ERATESDLEPLIEERYVADVDGAGQMVLVVDDEAQQREVTCDLLNGYGFDALAAASGAAVLAILYSQNVDLVITDQYMHGMDGWELLQHVRRQRPGLPVVLYSAVPPRPAKRGHGNACFDATLLKPADSRALLDQIQACIGAPAAVAATATGGRRGRARG